jgi:ATP-binding cassette subfamily G (WHITE) protein 2 (SNQ2)
MFNAQTGRMFTENVECTRVPLHNVDVDVTRDPHHQMEEAVSPIGNDGNDGTWGEHDVGGPVNFRAAMHEYEEMRRELTNLSKTRTNTTNKGGARRSLTALRKVTTGASRIEPELDLEAQGDEKSADDDEGEFELGDFLRDGHFEKRQSGESGESAKKVGVIYKHLTVQGVGASTTFVRTLPSAVIGVRKTQRWRHEDMLTTPIPDFRT